MDEYLPHFVFDARHQDWNSYPLKTLYLLVCGLQWFLRESGRPEVAIFDKKQLVFDRSRKALDARMKQLTMQGVGTATKTSEPLTVEQEILLWDKGFSPSTVLKDMLFSGTTASALAWEEAMNITP